MAGNLGKAKVVHWYQSHYMPASGGHKIKRQNVTYVFLFCQDTYTKNWDMNYYTVK